MPASDGSGFRAARPEGNWNGSESPGVHTGRDADGRVIGAARLTDTDWRQTGKLLGGLADAERFRIKSAEGTGSDRTWAQPWRRSGTDEAPFFVVSHGDTLLRGGRCEPLL